MSFEAFGKNSGPTGPPKVQPAFGHFPHLPSPPFSTPFPDSSAPPRAPSPRTFGAYEGVRLPSPFINARLGTGPPRPSVAPIRAPALQWGDRQNPLPGHVGGHIQKSSPPSGLLNHGSSISSKDYRFQDLERTRSPPVQYMEDFLNPDNDGKEGAAASLRWGDRQSSIAGDYGVENVDVPIQKRSPHNVSTSISSKGYSFQDPEKTRSPPVQYAEDFQNSDRDGEDGVSSPPKSRSRTGVLGMPKFQYNQRCSPSDDAMNGDLNGKKLANHTVSKRNRSPPAATAVKVSQTNIYSSEDDTERELQAKAKRLARFKTELDEAEPSDSIQYSLNVTRKKSSLVKTAQPAIEKKFFSGDYPSRSMEDVSQDFDNEDLSCSVIVGLCPDMCPESERAERERKGDLDRYERLDGDRNQTNKTLAVKKYNRTAERESELIRPMPILQRTMNYLLDLLDQPYDDRFLRLYNFLWDRMRAIRMDLRMQHIFNLEAITMLEQMLRLHIVAMHELCEFSKGEGFSEGFDAHLNIEQMNKTSVELFQLYDDHRKRGILIPTEKEFRGYYALLKLDKHPGYKVEPAELSLDLAKMTAEIRQTHEVLFARDVARSCRTSNFIAFFRHARKGSYLQACLMHAHFSKLRTQALASLHSGLLNNQGLPVSHVANWLGMEGEDIESLLEYHGFSIKEYEEPYMVKEGLFLNADKDYPTRCSILVHQKKSNAIIEDILSSRGTLLPSESKKEIQLDKSKIHKQAVIQPKQTESLVSEEVMDIEAVLSPRDRMSFQPALETSSIMPVQPLFETPRIGQPRIETQSKASVSSPKGNVTTPNTFASFISHSMKEEPSPVTPRDDSLIVDDGQLNYRSPPRNFSVPQSVPESQPPDFGWARETSNGGLSKSPLGSSPGIVVNSQFKATQPPIVSANDEKWMPCASEVNSGVASLVQDDAIMVVARKEYTDEHQEVQDDDDANYYDQEVAKAKLKLLIRLWKRRFARKREFREQNRFAASAALSSLSLGPPVRQIKDKPMHYRKLNIDQTVDERHEKLRQSYARWNVSDLVLPKLNERNMNSSCICWKVISFAWLHQGCGNIEAGNPVTHLPLDQWVKYKLMPQEDENANDLVLSGPDMSIWSKWVSDNFGAITCCLSVIKDAQSGNYLKKLDGVSAILFPLSETLPWELQRAELHNLIMCLPVGACVPLLILTGSSEDNVGEFPHSIVDKLGLNDIDKSRVGSFMILCLNEREGKDQFYGYFSDQRLKEGLMWLASESHPQPVLYNVTMRELVSSHLNICLDAHDMRGSDKLGPNPCISAFNEAVDRSIENIVAAANTNPTGWPCPDIFLLDDSTTEFRAVRQFLPSLGWSSSEEVEPLISGLRNCKLPSFSDDISWLNRGCSSMQDFETQRQFLQDSLITYLTQSSNVMNWMMATKEVDVMFKKCIRLELHDTEYKLVPNWLLIFRRVFNWQLNRLASINHKAYVLEHPHFTSNSAFLEKSNFEVSAPPFITHPSFDEMLEVSCSPIVSRRVKSSPECVQDISMITSVRSSDGVSMSNYIEDEQNRCSPIPAQPVYYSDIYMGENNSQMIPKVEKEPDKLSKLLEQCTALQDEIETKLSIYF